MRIETGPRVTLTLNEWKLLCQIMNSLTWGMGDSMREELGRSPQQRKPTYQGW